MSIQNKAVFLHHSTGNCIWKGNPSKIVYRIFKKGDVEKELEKLNKVNKTDYRIEERYFPLKSDNMPFDYYSIWINNSKEIPYKNEATIEQLAQDYGLIIWKHCFPVSEIEESRDSVDIDLNKKTFDNYKKIYLELKKKMKEFPDTKFLVWTGAVHVKNLIDEEQANRMKDFTDWIKNIWDEKGDNIYIWDFYSLETEGDIYFKDNYATNKDDSHPNKLFSQMVGSYFAKRIVNVMMGKGDITSITGKEK